MAASSRPAAASANARSTAVQKPLERAQQPLPAAPRGARRAPAPARPRSPAARSSLDPLERLPPRRHRVRLGAVRHVAHRGGERREVVLDAQQLQRVEAVALADARLLVAQLSDLAHGVKAEREDDAERDQEADDEPRRRVARCARVRGCASAAVAAGRLRRRRSLDRPASAECRRRRGSRRAAARLLARPPTPCSSSQCRATICTPTGSPVRRRPRRHRDRRVLQEVEPGRVAPRVEVVHARAHRSVHIALAVPERRARRAPGRAARGRLPSAAGTARAAASRWISTSSSRSAVSAGQLARVHSRNSGESSGAPRARVRRRAARAAAATRARRSPTKAPGPRRAPRVGTARPRPRRPRSAAAARRTASRMAGSTGVRPSSSNQPIRSGQDSTGVRHPVGLTPPCPLGQRQSSGTGCAVRVSDVGARHHRQQQRDVVHRAGHRADDAGERERAAAGREVPGGRHAPRRRLEADDAAEVRGHTDRAAAVAADAAGGEPRRDRRRLAAARPARRAREVPRAVGAPVAARCRSPTPSTARRRWSRRGRSRRPPSRGA